MKASNYPLFTQKNNPSDAEIISHTLMLKAGLVRQQSSGQYSFLPIGYRVLKKIEIIIREEMMQLALQKYLCLSSPFRIMGRIRSMGDIWVRIT
jgi:prolyl-tRNA synthetase